MLTEIAPWLAALQAGAQWIAPAATMIAAMMTAANLGTRITGWGFALFSVGAIAWVIVALASGQHNLLLSNGFLLVVDLVGVWRWLGRRARYDEGAQQAETASDAAPAPSLYAVSKIAGQPVCAPGGEKIATTVDAMAGRDDGAIRYLVVTRGGVGGLGETLHALGWGEVEIGEAAITTSLDDAALGKRPALDPTDWPASAEAAGVTA